MRGEVVTNPIQEAVIRRDLIANLDKLAPELADEIAAAVDELWGCDVKNYKIVSLDDTIFRIIARTSSRIFAGKTICKFRFCTLVSWTLKQSNKISSRCNLHRQ